MKNKILKKDLIAFKIWWNNNGDGNVIWLNDINKYLKLKEDVSVDSLGEME